MSARARTASRPKSPSPSRPTSAQLRWRTRHSCGHDAGFWALGGGAIEYVNCTSRNDRHPFSLEAHAKSDGTPADTHITFRGCSIEPATDHVFFRREGNVSIDTDGSIKVD